MVSFFETEDLFNLESGYFDSEISVILIDEDFFQKQASPKICILTMITVITVREIDITHHIRNVYAIVLFMFKVMQIQQPVFAKFWQEIYFVNNLKTNFFISII